MKNLKLIGVRKYYYDDCEGLKKQLREHKKRANPEADEIFIQK